MAMTGKTKVDGVDIYDAYGVYITAGGWNSLVAMPPLKTPESNDWQEEDGVEEDLSAPVLDTREVTVSFACGSSASRLFDFIALLSDGAYHKFKCLWIGRTYTLRLVSQSKLSYNPALGTFSLKLADDFPVREGYEYEGPDSDLPDSTDYVLRGISEDVADTPLTRYGVRVLSGTLSNVLATPDVKPNLLRNIAAEAGAEYDDAAVTFKSKDVKLNCLMRAGTLEGLWRNWDALLHDLVRPGARGLYVASAGAQTFDCRYKSCSVSAFNPEGRPWLQFTLTLAFTGDQRIFMGDWLLSSEDGAFVTTEDGADRIDMRPTSPLTAYGASRDSGVSGLSVETYADEGGESGVRKVKVSELEECSDLTGLWTLGTDRDNDSVKVSLEFVAEAAQNANGAAVNANEAASSATSAAQTATDAAASATTAADSANQAAQSVGDAVSGAETAATNANGAADSANTAAQTASASAAGADSAATNANAAAQAAYDAIDALGDIANIVPITDEEIDGLLKNFNFIDSFTVTAEGEYPLTLEAANSAEGADITGSVDISEIDDDDIRKAFENG